MAQYFIRNENQHDRGDRSTTECTLSIGFDWCILFKNKYGYIDTFIPAVFFFFVFFYYQVIKLYW